METEIKPIEAKPTEMQSPSFSVALSIYEWHHLLNSMEEMMNIVNRDQKNIRILYGEIATQLAGHSVNVMERPPQPPDQSSKPVPIEPPKENSKTFLQRIFPN
jgi:hypothetical protein